VYSFLLKVNLEFGEENHMLNLFRSSRAWSVFSISAEGILQA